MPFAEKKAVPYVFTWKGPLCSLRSSSGKDVLSISETTPVPAQSLCGQPQPVSAREHTVPACRQ